MEKQYSVIIPTLWRSDRIFQLIYDLQRCNKIGEIIIVDNGNRFYEFFTNTAQKLKPLIPSKNIYVNPSWNAGVAYSKYENIAILNDDVYFSMELFDIIDDTTLNNNIIGMDSLNYHHASFLIEPEFKVMTTDRPWGWGCVLLFKKKNWVPIPENIKIWYGDDWMVQKNPTTKLVLHNFPIKTEMSTTSNNTEFDNIKKQDEQNYKEQLWK
jgi:hypothetical protein